MMLMLFFLLEPVISESVQQTVAESEDSEDEWNYVKIDKKAPEGLTAVEETQEAESPVVESKVVVEAETIPVSLNRRSQGLKTKFKRKHLSISVVRRDRERAGGNISK